MSILDRIIERTKEDVGKRKKAVALSDFNGFEDYGRPRRSLREALSAEGVSILAEIKKASPSKGLMRADFDPVHIARAYEDAGAAAISVLTDEPFFQGKGAYLTAVSRVVGLPVLRKDFIVDPYQIEEARAWGADAVLLIATVLDAVQLNELHHAAEEAGLECLVEAYDASELARIDFRQVRVFGVNNRNLGTFEVDVHRGILVLKQAPEGVVLVSESGLATRADLDLLSENGIHAALIGEHFMRQADPGEALRAISDKR
jgi:indole-3-glycerol phosphate synthase